MKLKGPERVCFSSSSRARVLPEIAEQEAMPVAGSSTRMIGRTRCSPTMMEIVEALAKEDIKIESHTHNRLKLHDRFGHSVVVDSRLEGKTAVAALSQQLTAAGMVPKLAILERASTEEFSELKERAGTVFGGIDISDGTVFLLEQLLDSLIADLKSTATGEVERQVQEMQELLSVAEAESATAVAHAERAVASANAQRDEARQRAEKAERALSALTTAMRGAQELVSGS